MGEKKYQCEECGQYFKTPNALGAHKKLKHGISVEKVTTNAFLDVLRGLHDDIIEIKEKLNTKEVNDMDKIEISETDIRDGFDSISESTVQGISVVLRRIDSLERRLEDSENTNAQAVIDAVSKVLERVDELEKKIKNLNFDSGIKIDNEKQLRERLEKLLPLLQKYGIDIVVEGYGEQRRAKVRRFKSSSGFTKEEEEELRKAIEQLLPLMGKFNIEVRNSRIQKRSSIL